MTLRPTLAQPDQHTDPEIEALRADIPRLEADIDELEWRALDWVTDEVLWMRQIAQMREELRRMRLRLAYLEKAAA